VADESDATKLKNANTNSNAGRIRTKRG
jgi:hypothetical protein